MKGDKSASGPSRSGDAKYSKGPNMSGGKNNVGHSGGTTPNRFVKKINAKKAQNGISTKG